MARDFTKFILSSQDTILTSKGMLIWPSLFKKQGMKGDPEDKWSWNTTLLIPAGHDMSILVNRVNEIIADNLTEAQRKTTKIKKPFKKLEDAPKILAMLDKADIDPAKFQGFFRASSKTTKPVVLGPNMGAIEDETEQYSGRWACLSVRPFWWKHDANGVGISIGLGNVQLLDQGDVLAGGRVDATKEFEAVGDAESASSVFD